MTELCARPATKRAHADRIRLIRNATRGTYSQNNEEISWCDQQQWWERTKDKRLAWLYHQPGDHEIVGFGVLLLQDDGYWTTTVGVLPAHAGKGYGKAITHDLVVNAPGPCRAMALIDNPAGVRCHDLEQDWDVVDGPDPKYVYFRTKAGVLA
jgi:GNAT superfamily N-acetyltransferase